MQEISEKIWQNEKFHAARRDIEHAWISLDINLESEPPNTETSIKAMQAAAILSCSEKQEHRQAAFRVATCLYGLYCNSDTRFDQALRVILTRLSNFPSLLTKPEVFDQNKKLPLSLAIEETQALENNQIKTESGPLLMTPFQLKLWEELQQKKSAAISAPTSAGKSYVLRKHISSTISKSDKILYIVPTRALITQVANDIYKEFQQYNPHSTEVITVSLDTSEEIPNSVAFVMTQERAQLLLSGHPELSPNLLVIDEAHAISDGSRGILLQSVIDEVLRRNPETQVLFASPMIENLGIFSRLFNIEKIDQIKSFEPAVLQNFLKIQINDTSKGDFSIDLIDPETNLESKISTINTNQKLNTRAKALSRIAARLGRGSVNIIYANGADEAEKIAINLSVILRHRADTIERNELSQIATDSVHSAYELGNCLRKGVAFHYGEVPAQLRREIEQAVSDGIIDFLVCTSTLLQGVNLPAKNIFLLKPEKGSNQPLRATDFWNLSGRAGRLLKEFQGNILLINYDHWKEQPLTQPKKEQIEPSLARTINNQYPELLREIRNKNNKTSSDPQIESSFMRLYLDSKSQRIDESLQRLGISSESTKSQYLIQAINRTHSKITLPESILKQSPSISPHKQQSLYIAIKERLVSQTNSLEELMPAHPKRGGYWSFVGILSECQKIILGYRPDSKIARFHGVIAIKWMRGDSLPQIIEAQLQRPSNHNSRSTIRNILEVIEKDLRFQAVRLITCYTSILRHILIENGEDRIAEKILPLALFLEVGASDATTISLITLGLSRSTAKAIAAKCAQKNLTAKQAKDWLQKIPTDKLGLSNPAIKELKKLHLNAITPDRI